MKRFIHVFLATSLVSGVACTNPNADSTVNPDPDKAQQGVVKGRVVDSTGKKIVANMHAYQFYSIPVGRYNITARDRVTRWISLLLIS